MTLIDLIALVLIVAYGVLGWFSGTVRRVIGLVGVYIAALIATNMGQFAGGILRQYSPTISVPDARLAGWLFFLALLVLAFEGAATAVHSQLQLAVVALNRGVGVLLGLVTSIVLLMAGAYMVTGYANAQTTEASSTQLSTRDQLQHSAVLLPVAKSLGIFALPFLTAALPRENEAYFIFEGTHQ